MRMASQRKPTWSRQSLEVSMKMYRTARTAMTALRRNPMRPC